MKTLKVGDKLPEFIAIDENGNNVKSTNWIGKKTIIFFYPRANTPGCTAEACNLRDNFKELSEMGYQLIGVSADNPKKQKKFIDKYKLPFTLLADEEKVVIESFGVWGPKKFQGREYDGIHRMTFLINESGIIEKVIDKVKTKNHSAQIIEVK